MEAFKGEPIVCHSSVGAPRFEQSSVGGEGAGPQIFPNKDYQKHGLKLNTMQLVTPGGNHCCLITNDVQNSRLFHSFINILSTVYEHDNRKQLYINQTSSRWKKVNKIRHFTFIADLNVPHKE